MILMISNISNPLRNKISINYNYPTKIVMLNIKKHRCYTYSCRQRSSLAEKEVFLARIRLGHTHLTHSYLLKREDQPECVGSACPLTVQHIMIDCVEFAYIRSRFSC